MRINRYTYMYIHVHTCGYAGCLPLGETLLSKSLSYFYATFEKLFA